MHNLILPGADLSQPSLTIDGPDAHHLSNVLRVKAGEILTLLDNAGRACLAEVMETGKKSLSVCLLGSVDAPPEPPIHITVAQALGKGDKFEQVIQHATEIGASSFIPLITERTIARLESRDSNNKFARWSQIAKSAAEQAGRGRIPTIQPV